MLICNYSATSLGFSWWIFRNVTSWQSSIGV